MNINLIENICPRTLKIPYNEYLMVFAIGIQKYLTSFLKKKNLIIKNNNNFQSFKLILSLELNALIQSCNTALTNTPQNIPNALLKVNPSAMFNGMLNITTVNGIGKIEVNFNYIRNILFDKFSEHFFN